MKNSNVNVSSLKVGDKLKFALLVRSKESFFNRLMNLFTSEKIVDVSIEEAEASSISNYLYNEIKRNKKKTESPKTEKKVNSPSMKAPAKTAVKKEGKQDPTSKPKRNYRKKPSNETSTNQSTDSTITSTQQ